MDGMWCVADQFLGVRRAVVVKPSFFRGLEVKAALILVGSFEERGVELIANGVILV
jgi:hypothetical protein